MLPRFPGFYRLLLRITLLGLQKIGGQQLSHQKEENELLVCFREIKRLEWNEVDPSRRHIEVKAAKAKSAPTFGTVCKEPWR